MGLTFPEYCWRDTALGDLNKRNRVMAEEKVKDHLPKHRRECYTSIWRFAEEFKDYVQNTGSVKGFVGVCYSDTFWLDVDDEDLRRSQESALFVGGILMKEVGVPLEDLRFFFSGKKGFHIGIPSKTFGVEPSIHLPAAFSELARQVSEAAGVSADMSIYRYVSLLRLPNSINDKSGLFKIGVTFEEMGGPLEDILEMAKEPRRKLPEGPGEPNDVLGLLFRQIMREALSAAKEDRRRVDLPMVEGGRMAEAPKWDKMCIYRIMKGVPNGQRNNAALRVAVHFRQKGMPLDMAVSALQSWNTHNETPLEDVDIVDVAERAYANEYDFGCHDPVLDRYCHKDCYIYDKKMGEEREESTRSVYTIPELLERYRNYTAEGERARATWGIDWLDAKTQKISPGQVAMIAARAGVGKTALTLHLLRANSEEGITSLFCSLEQLGSEIFERMAQNANEVTTEEVFNAFLNSDEEQIETLGNVTASSFANVYVCDDDRLTIKQLKARVKMAEERAGQKIRLLAVDYLGRMKGDGKDYYAKISDLAIGLKEVAKECELAVVVLVQVNRSGGKGSDEVTLDMARDSGQIEEAVDYAVGVWQASDEGRDGNSKGEGKVAVKNASGGISNVAFCRDYYPVIIQINKNRKGPKGEGVRCGFYFRPTVMRFEGLHWRPDGSGAQEGTLGI